MVALSGLQIAMATIRATTSLVAPRGGTKHRSVLARAERFVVLLYSEMRKLSWDDGLERPAAGGTGWRRGMS